MTENLTLAKIESIMLFQRRFRFINNELKRMNEIITFYQDTLLSMTNNLLFLNNKKIFHNTDSHYIIILNEIKTIKNLLNKVPDKITFKHLKKVSLNKWGIKLLEINQLLTKYMNHISPENLNYILKLYCGDNWLDLFEKNDLEKILFLSRFFKPICVWDSNEHKKIIKYPKNDKEKPKSMVITKDILRDLMGGNKNTSIVIGDSSKMPSFLKSINELVERSERKKTVSRKNHFNEIECIAITNDENIKITKNKKSISLIEDKYGACVYFKLEKKFIVIQGIFKDDLLNVANNVLFIKEKLKEHKGKINYEAIMVPRIFKENYFKIINIRDIITSNSSDIVEDVKKKYNDYKNIQSKTLITLVNEFVLASKYRKIDILTLLLMSNKDNRKLAFIIYEYFKSKDKKNESKEIYNSLHHSIRVLLDDTKAIIEAEESKLKSVSISDIPYDRRINMLNVDDNVKSKAMNKLKSIKSNFQGDNKAQSWLDGLLKIPFNVYRENNIMTFKENFCCKIKKKYPCCNLYSENEINLFIENLEDKSDVLINEWNDYQQKKMEYMKDIRKTLDDAVYGHKEAKQELERIFAQWINGESKGAIIGLQGPPGTGKTSLAKNGLSKCLKDNNDEPRPFAFLPIGGSVNGSTLVGHNYTYVGSTWGRIVDILITSQCMNPIIFIDEVDKVSHTEHGREIISILTHLTDLTQNDEFEDKYFAGIKLDLSKALIVFSFNDISMIDPILRDRITIIETNPLTMVEKVVIIREYMLPELLKMVGFSKDEIIISDEMIKYMVETYTNEAGVRKIKEKVLEIVRDINLQRFYNTIDSNITIPFSVTKEYIDLLFENKPKVRIKKIPKQPMVGLVNGLYATRTGIGGLTVIQVMKYPAEKMLELTLTGKQGEVMKESVNYAVKIAFSLLSEEQQMKIIEDAHNKKAFGLHVHTPEAAVPKDGPSAGAAMTLAIYSLLANKKVDNKLAMTGEIDLCRNVTAIGGVGPKLTGAKRAGVTKALIPKENMEDLERLRREGSSPEDKTFTVFPIETIEDVLKHALVDINELSLEI